jgi:hypothetical protein
MPYRHPVAVAANVLWWGIFLGCLGASIGALLGLWKETPGTEGGAGFSRTGTERAAVAAADRAPTVAP